MFKEFKEFVSRGNVVDMAVGIIIGGAFGKIITSFVNDVIMPPIGLALGGVDFKNLVVTLKAAVGETPAVEIKYGLFINTTIDFLIIAFVIFLAVRTINRLKRPEQATAAEPTTRDCPKCFTSISVKATRCPNCTSDLK